MRFIVFVIDDKTNSGSSAEMAAIDAFNEKLQANQNWIYAAGIADASESKLIDNRDGANQMKAGSLVNQVENYSGFWLIQCESEAAAAEIAAEGSRACNRQVELRPFLGQ